MSKISWSNVAKRVARFLATGLIIYLVICLVLIYWPIPQEKEIKNYDYSSIGQNSRLEFSKTQWIKARDGRVLFSRIYPSENKDVLILIHGSGSEGRYLSTLADTLAKAKVATVVTPDLRGHGENSGAGDIDYIGQLEDDLDDLIDYCRKNLGAKKITLAGHSSGGGFVLRFIGNKKNRPVDGAIMLAPYLGYDAITVKPNSGGWVRVALKRIIGLSMLNNLGLKMLNGLPVLFFNRPEDVNDKLQVASYSFRMTMNFGPKNYKEEIKNINIPCLVLVGQQDESFYPEKFEEAFRPAKKLVKTELLDTKHLSLVSDQKTVEEISRWMKGK